MKNGMSLRRGRGKKGFVAGRKQHFLRVLAECGNVTAAVEAAGVSRTCAYETRQNDEAFAQAWSEAEEIAADRLEAEAWRRGVEGGEEPVISLGKVVERADGAPLMIRRYSDTLLALLLRAHRPEKYRERASVEVDVSDKLWARLEAARQRAIGSGVGAVREVLELQPVAEEGAAEPAEPEWTVDPGSSPRGTAAK